MDKYVIYWVMNRLSTITTLLAIIFTLRQLNRQSISMRWLAIALAFSFISDIAGLILIAYGGNPNISNNTYVIISTSLISAFFCSIITWRSTTRVAIVVNIIYLIFALINVSFIQKIDLNTYTFIIQSIIII